MTYDCGAMTTWAWVWSFKDAPFVFFSFW